MLIQSEGEYTPKNPLDRRLDTSLRKGFEASSQASIMARAVISWVDKLAKSESELTKRALNSLKKISVAPAFMADTSLDSVQLSTRAMANQVVSCRNVWLREWNKGDSTSASRLAILPSKGEKTIWDIS